MMVKNLEQPCCLLLLMDREKTYEKVLRMMDVIKWTKSFLKANLFCIES